MPSDKINLEDVGRLLRIAREHGLEEITVREDDITVTVRAPKASHAVPVVEGVSVAAPAVPRKRRKERAGPEHETPPAEHKGVNLVAPMTGVFYRAPSPDAPNFVEVGDVVAPGQTIGLIEAMKVFSEVPAEIGGRVLAILADNGKLVQADEPLMSVDPADAEEG